MMSSTLSPSANSPEAFWKERCPRLQPSTVSPFSKREYRVSRRAEETCRYIDGDEIGLGGSRIGISPALYISPDKCSIVQTFVGQLISKQAETVDMEGLQPNTCTFEIAGLEEEFTPMTAAGVFDSIVQLPDAEKVKGLLGRSAAFSSGGPVYEATAAEL